MTVRAVDVQTTITRAQDVGSQQGQKDNQLAAAQQAFATQLRQKAEREQTQVRSPMQAEKPQVRGRGSGDRRGGQQREPARREGQQDGEVAADAREPGKGTRLDVRL